MTSSAVATGEWVAVPLPDGSVRHDWQPHEQPPSPDGSVGFWRLVPGPVDGFGNWVWFPQRPAPVAVPPTPGAGDPPSPLTVRLLVLVVCGLLVAAGFFVATRDGGAEEEERPGVSTLPGSQKERLLVDAATGYTTALLAGKGPQAARYLDPKACHAADRRETADLAAFLAQSAPGATVRVRGVQVSGDDGAVTGYEFSTGVPTEVRAVVEKGYTSGGEFSWHLRGEQWFFDAEC